MLQLLPIDYSRNLVDNLPPHHATKIFMASKSCRDLFETKNYWLKACIYAIGRHLKIDSLDSFSIRSMRELLSSTYASIIQESLGKIIDLQFPDTPRTLEQVFIVLKSQRAKQIVNILRDEEVTPEYATYLQGMHNVLCPTRCPITLASYVCVLDLEDPEVELPKHLKQFYQQETGLLDPTLPSYFHYVLRFMRDIPYRGLALRNICNHFFYMIKSEKANIDYDVGFALMNHNMNVDPNSEHFITQRDAFRLQYCLAHNADFERAFFTQLHDIYSIIPTLAAMIRTLFQNIVLHSQPANGFSLLNFDELTHVFATAYRSTFAPGISASDAPGLNASG